LLRVPSSIAAFATVDLEAAREQVAHAPRFAREHRVAVAGGEEIADRGAAALEVEGAVHLAVRVFHGFSVGKSCASFTFSTWPRISPAGGEAASRSSTREATFRRDAEGEGLAASSRRP
jgi:hypothetical protein